ncbi:hypothetical protein GCM10011360_16360 [Primorskyibacter flagellatus]|uniref:UrcA family protein n=1 Tax=Primorskyibacter flagellatus TaxID=1387277 RepID=A0A917EDV3_9RHOB|nr:hypothetical protein [Primorskyibacter flagellatus]GGE28949.1 hypothetical protein GCM10011360_16360 [Primorskyibacter flagellatus]
MKTAAIKTVALFAAIGGAAFPAFAEQTVATPVAVSAPDVILTDAIRIEVASDDPAQCALAVIRAFNLPEGSLNYDPRCTVVGKDAPFTSALND